MLISVLKLKFNILRSQQFPTSSSPVCCQPDTQDLDGNLSHHRSPPLWEKIMKIRFALNRFFMAARNNAILESLYMQFTLPHAWQKPLAFHCAWSMALCTLWLNLAGEVMANVMTTDVKGWRLIPFPAFHSKPHVHAICLQIIKMQHMQCTTVLV